MAIATLDQAPTISHKTNNPPIKNRLTIGAPTVSEIVSEEAKPIIPEAEYIGTVYCQGKPVALGDFTATRIITEPNALSILHICANSKAQIPSLWTNPKAPFDNCLDVIIDTKYQPAELVEWMLDSVSEIVNPEITEGRQRRINAPLAECLQGLIHNGVSPQTHSDAFNIAIEPFKQLDGWKVDDIMFYYDYIVKENQSAEVLPAAQSIN